MTSADMRDTGVPTPRTAYHNSGCGPREVFNTPAVGTAITFDIGRTLRTWPPVAEDRLIRDKLPLSGAAWISPDIIDRACSITLDHLGTGHTAGHGIFTTARARALKSLELLAAEVCVRGALVRVVGIARALLHPPGYSPACHLTELDLRSPLEIATTFVAVSVFAPPLILWRRPPSLTWWRLDHVIEFRTFAASSRVASGAIS